MMTSEPLPTGGNPNQGLLFDWSPEDSPASHSQPPVSGLVPPIIGGDGRGSGTSFTWFDQSTSSWRTCQDSLGMTDSGSCSVIWPTSGSMRNGECYPRAPWVRHTHVSGCSSWPTPMASFGHSGWGVRKDGTYGKHRKPRYGRNSHRNVISAIARWGFRPPPVLIEWLMGLPRGWLEPEGTPLSRRSVSSSEE